MLFVVIIVVKYRILITNLNDVLSILFARLATRYLDRGRRINLRLHRYAVALRKHFIGIENEMKMRDF